jgi:hypothetical protein
MDSVYRHVTSLGKSRKVETGRLAPSDELDMNVLVYVAKYMLVGRLGLIESFAGDYLRLCMCLGWRRTHGETLTARRSPWRASGLYP